MKRFYAKSGICNVVLKFKKKMRIAKYKAIMGVVKFEKNIKIYDWIHPKVLRIEKLLGMPMRCENCADKFCCEQYAFANVYQIARCYSKESDK
jgi:hypothetical protein